MAKYMAGNETIFSDLVNKDVRKNERHSGIYAIRNLVNQKVYIGQSINIFRRIRTHRTNLNRNVHGNAHLQSSWNKYGKENFSFEALELCNTEDLNLKEFEWISKYNSADKNCGYNSMIPDPAEKKFRHSEETREKLRNTADFSKDELLSALEEFFYMEGRIIEPEDRDNPIYSGYPNVGHYTTSFGSIGAAIEILGLSKFDKKAKLRKRHTHTKENIIRQFQNFIDKHGHFPTSKDIKRASLHDLPTHYAIKKVFGGFPQLRDAMGYPVSDLKEQKKELSLIALRKLSETERLSYQSIEESPITKSTRYYKDNFGSVQNAILLAGITDQMIRFKANDQKEVV